MEYKFFKIKKAIDPGIAVSFLGIHFNHLTKTMFIKKTHDNGHREVSFRYLGSFFESTDDPDHWEFSLPIDHETQELVDLIAEDDRFLEYKP